MSFSNITVIFGLGNPGERYQETPHNVGFRLVDFLADQWGARWSFPDERLALAPARFQREELLLVKPMTYMNLSGDAIRALGQRKPAGARSLLVLCDDIALPWGHIRLRKRGSDGGHNGLKSIIATLGSHSFPRLRLGVGPVPEGMDPADYVTGPIPELDRAAAEKMVRHAAKCVETALSEGVDTAMNRFNTRVRETGDTPTGEGPGT